MSEINYINDEKELMEFLEKNRRHFSGKARERVNEMLKGKWKPTLNKVQSLFEGIGYYVVIIIDGDWYFNLPQFVELINKVKKNWKYTYKELADEMDMNEGTLSNILRGSVKNITYETLSKMVYFLDGFIIASDDNNS